jgi:predicted AlkP superfamily phosphohydrolase/phosphomutase
VPEFKTTLRYSKVLILNKSKNNGSPTNPKRVLIFSIDGAAWEIIDYLIQQGKLPNFKRIMKEGAYGNLQSVNPPTTCPAWATMFTGKRPDNLEVFHFFTPTTDYNLKLSKLYWKKWRPVWDIFSEKGKFGCVFNVPTTTAYKINGYFISGPIWGETESLLAYPPKFDEELKKSGYQIRTDLNNKVSGDKVYVEEVKRITKKKFQIMFNYFQKNDWDFFIMAFYYCDQLQHLFWSDFDKKQVNTAIFDHYELLDDFLGRIIEKLPKNAVLFITSDHGHTGVNRGINLNAWLYRKGFLELKDNYVINKANKISKSTTNGLLKSLYFFSQVISKSLYYPKLREKEFSNKVQLKLKSSIAVAENKFALRNPLHDYVDWNRTKAYSTIFNTFFINLKNREIHGTVQKKNYKTVRKNIVDELRKFRDPINNQRIINKIWVKEEIYPNSTNLFFPDIYIQLNKGYRNFVSDLYDPTEIFVEVQGSTEHSLNGIFLAYGPEIRAGKKIENAKLEDIVPTILHLFQYSIPNDIDGRVLTEIFEPDSDAGTREISREKIETKFIQSMKFSKKI